MDGAELRGERMKNTSVICDICGQGICPGVTYFEIEEKTEPSMYSLASYTHENYTFHKECLRKAVLTKRAMLKQEGSHVADSKIPTTDDEIRIQAHSHHMSSY